MSNRQTLQNVWSMTDKPIIDKMTKPKHKSTTAAVKGNYSKDNSDSDSADSSNGSFVAVPEEFRPDLTPYLREERSETSKVPHSQNLQKPFTQSPNLTNESERSERYFRIIKKISSVQKMTEVAASTASENAPNKMANNLSFQTQCVSMSKSLNKNQGNNKLQYEHNGMVHEPMKPKMSNEYFDKFGRYLPPYLGKNNDETGQVPHSQNSKKALIRSPKLTNESEKSERISRILKPIPPVQKTEGASKMPNCKVVRFTTPQEATSKKMINNSLFQKQCQTPISKTPNKEQENKLQYEHVGIEHETIQLNFELPSKGLKFERKFFEQKEIVSRNENTNSYFRMRQDNMDRKYEVSFEENIVKWDSTLNLNAENVSDQNEIEWTVIREKKMYSSKRQNDKSKINMEKKLNNNECKFKNPNHTRKQPLRENSYHRKLNSSSLQYETNFNEESNQNPIKSKEFECRLETVFYENNLQLESNSNCNGTKHGNYNTKAKLLSTNEGGFARQYSTGEQTISSNSSINQSSPLNVLKENIQQEFKQNWGFSSEQSSSDSAKAKDTEELNFILDYGKDISDLILGSHTTLSMFISLYKEWRVSRQKLIEHFELLEKNLKESTHKFTIYRDVINMANTGATLATAIPHPYVSIAARIVSALTGLFSAYLNKPNNENIENDSDDITTYLFKDNQESSELYMYGLQCNQQFDETNKVIEKFHSNIAEHKLSAIENREIAKFVEGLLEYRPTHRIFYKKVHKCFQELLQTGTSSSAKKLCEPFLLGPSTAVDVIGHLDWRFQYEDFNSESVRYELEQLHRLIQNSNTTSLKDPMQKIQNCIRILRDELAFVDRSIRDLPLFDISPSFKG